MLNQIITDICSSSNGVQIKQGDNTYEVDYIILAAGFAPNTKMILESCNLNPIEHTN